MSQIEGLIPPYRISLSLPTPSLTPDAPPTSTQHLGTVLYSGPIPPTAGLWLGVEWDEPSRGKHSGVHEPSGVRYFDCRAPRSGSFIRPTAKGISTGRTFSAALRDKYLDEGSSAPPSSEEVRSSAGEGSTMYATESNFEVEVPSLERIRSLFRQLDRLREVGLEWEGVASAGAEEELREVGQQLEKLRVVNLSFSLLSRLEDADRIAGALSGLTTLYLNSNRFARIQTPTLLPAFARLTTLTLNSTLLSWAEILHIAPSLSALKHLELGYNGLKSLDGPQGWRCDEGVLGVLEELNLEGNELCEWTEVESALGRLPSLRRLILTKNRLASLSLPHPSRFTTLRHLSLSSNLLKSWSSLDPLDKLPALESLGLAGNPVLEGETEERGGVSRLRVLGRVGAVTELEGSRVHPPERDDAERFYLAEIARDEKLATDEQRAAAHPRYQELTKKHGTVSAPEPKQSLRSRLIQLHVEFPPSLPPKPSAPHTLSVLPTLKTLLLRSHLAKVTGKPVLKTKYKLVAVLAPARLADGQEKDAFRSEDLEEGAALEVPIDVGEEGRELSFWGLQDGDTLRVVEV